MLRLEFADGINRVRFSCSPQLNVRYVELWSIGKCEAHHFEPMGCWSERVVWFMGRVAGRDEENPGELQALMHVMGNRQVTIVDRIEASTEQAPFQW